MYIGSSSSSPSPAEGVTLLNLTFEGNSAVNGQGGAIYRSGNIRVNVWKSSLTYNSALEGGGVYLKGGSSHMSLTRLVSNTGSSNGGGLMMEGMERLTLDSCTMQGNNASISGGGIYVSGEAVLEAEDNVYSNNTARGNSDSNGGGGALYINDMAIVTSTNDRYSNNQATQGYGGGLYAATNVQWTCSSCTLEDNTAQFSGGAIYTLSAKVSFTNYTVIRSNEAKTGDGGGLYWASQGNLSVSHTSFQSNRALQEDQGRGGAIAFQYPVIFSLSSVLLQSNEAMYGGGVYSPEGTPSFIVNNTVVASNTATVSGGGFYSNATSS